MAKLTIVLLGRPQFFVDGIEITNFNTRKDCALLAYLAATGTTHSREALASLLWSELPRENARRNLRHALSHLQKTLGLAWLKTEQEVALTQEQPWSVDVQTLRSALKKLMASPAPVLDRQDTTQIEALDQALQLYRGEFLQGFHVQDAVRFEEWVLAQREELHLLVLRGLETLVERSLAQGAYEQGLTATRRLLQLEPWSEPAHCLQMQLLAYSGRRADALAQYETCRQLLASELGVEPLPTTTALYQQIKHGQYNPALPALQSARSGGAALQPPVHQAPAANKPLVPHNLVAPLAGFVGRQAELDLICQRLTASTCRLLTIVGPGGMGKTSLAHAVGQQLLSAAPHVFPDGLYFVPLLDVGAAGWDQTEQAPSADPVSGEAILRAVAAQLGYKLEGDLSPAVQLEAYLGERRLLLILDNFEHLLAGTEAIVTLLSKTPSIKVLITSRARLNVRGETVLALAKLSLPADNQANIAAQTASTSPLPPEVWQASEALAMFVQRAQQHDPFFTVTAATLAPITQICQLVDGLPLGIELATSMLPLLNCTQLAAELAQSLDFLTADTWDLPPAQRTLGAVFERSWALLPAEGQQLLARLAIFPGSFRREAAEQIVGASLPLLRRLLDQSLLTKASDERYSMHRTVHTFAQRKLQQWPAQNEELRKQYAQFYLAFLARLGAGLTETAYETLFAQIQAELDNVRTAWQWSIDRGDLTLLELGLESLFDFYETAGIYAEAIQLLEAAQPVIRNALALTPAAPQPQRLLARLLCYTAQCCRFYAQANEAQKGEGWAQEALKLGRQLADPALQSLAHHELARAAQARQDYATMRRLAEQAYTYAQQANLPRLMADSLNDWGVAVALATEPQAGIVYFQEALGCLRQQPVRALEIRILSNLTVFNLASHEYQAAYGYLLQLRARRHLLLDWFHFGDLLRALGAYAEAQKELTQELAVAQAQHAPYWGSWLHISYGRLQWLQGDLAAAQTSARLAVQIAHEHGNYFVEQQARIDLGRILTDLGDFAAAEQCYQQAITSPIGEDWFAHVADAYAGLAALRLAENAVATAVRHVEAALALLAQHGLAAASEPFIVYWTCIRVLEAAGDPRAPTVLATAYQALQKTANQLEEAHLRRSFLENVVVNRKLVAAAQAAGLVGVVRH